MWVENELTVRRLQRYTLGRRRRFEFNRCHLHRLIRYAIRPFKSHTNTRSYTSHVYSIESSHQNTHFQWINRDITYNAKVKMLRNVCKQYPHFYVCTSSESYRKLWFAVWRRKIKCAQINQYRSIFCTNIYFYIYNERNRFAFYVIIMISIKFLMKM